VSRELKNELESKSYVSEVEIQWSIEYDVEILLDTKLVEQLGLSINQVSQAVRAYNQNSPLWNYEVDGYEYDFRIQWERN
jgi:multidrug efflux pump subunit AcrB